VQYCSEEINKHAIDNNAGEHRIISLMNTMSRIATAEELAMLNKFYVTISEPYYNTDYDGDSQNIDKIVGPADGPFYNEIAEVVLCSGQEREELGDAEDDLVLPEGTIKSVTYHENAPAWLKDIVEDKEVDIEIRHDPAGTFSYNYWWNKAEIVSEKDIKILTLENSGYETRIYYKTTAQDIDYIQSAVFAMKKYSDEGDQWSTQEEYFDNEIREDVSKITGRFNLCDLFNGLDVTGVNISKIRSITVVADKTITVTTEDGAQKVLKIAA
jgi:hypothetical protein